MQEGLWATEDSSSKSLLSYPCPPQYCQCAFGIQGRTVTCRYTFDSKNKDSQCTCDRKGNVCMWHVTMFQHMYMMCHWVCVYVFVIHFACVVSLCRCCVYTCCVIVQCVCLCVCTKGSMRELKNSCIRFSFISDVRTVTTTLCRL